MVPKRKPLPLEQPLKDAPPASNPKKYVAFSSRDSRAIEFAFRRLVEEEDRDAQDDNQSGDIGGLGLDRAKTVSTTGQSGNPSADDDAKKPGNRPTRVPVNEDFLFDVDIEKRELAPAYWFGPIYDVRRGSWFYQEGSTVRPCDENLANQLEEGYLKTKPWRYEAESQMPIQSQSRPRSQSRSTNGNVPTLDGATASKPVLKSSAEDLKAKADSKEATTPISAKFQLQTQRLFGAYMNSVVTYQDANTAWILTDDLYSRMSSTVYQRFAGGGHLGGTKVIRGFTESSKAKDKKSEAGLTHEISKLDTGKTPRNQKRRSAPPEIATSVGTDTQAKESDSRGQSSEDNVQQESKIAALERQMSSIVSSPGPEDPAKQEEQARQGDEDEIEQDYKEADGDDPGREIEHLILVTHGIGQRLGLRVENLNFIRDVNKLRKTLKSVYDASPDLQALNNELEKLPKNCRVQVLPVVWRHLLDFPKQSFKQNGKEQDLTDADAFGEEEKYPSLDDITVEGVPGIRNLITDLALDILLYQSAYREHIAGIVQRECNRIYELFLQRNPKFNGKISLVGHSLGSAILFDILCRQKDSDKSSSLPRDNCRSRRVGSLVGQSQSRDLGLNFEVESFFCLGSPLGLYQMLKGRKIAARDTLQGLPSESSLDSGLADDLFLGGSSVDPSTANDSDLLTVTVSSPKCQQLFNIFHPADAIAYRLEPLISPAMSSLKPQPLPYTKRGIFTPGQGFTGIGARVGQSVSGLWTNITSGVASSLLNRSLGISGDEQNQSTQSIAAPTAPTVASSATVNANATGGDVGDEAHPQTLIDSDIETLYAGFQKRRRSQQSDDARDLGERPEWQDTDARARKLKREEAKVRALNSNGRVDFSIQEDWDNRTSFRDSSDRGGFTTVKRYRIPNREEDDERLTVYNRDRDRDHRSDRGFEETRIVRRERTPEPEPERREIRIERFERDRLPSPPRIDRDIRIERYEREREPDRRPYERDYRYEREVERPRRDPYDVERYSKSVEYFPRPDPPQPIIIRQEPQQIIIQEAPRAPIVVPAPQKDESEFQLIQRSEINEDRQIARREPERREPEREEDYYYERRVREVSRDNRSRRDDDDDFYEERYRRREVSPGDSVSQVGRRRDRDYSSDDSIVYIRKETRDTYGRDESPHHKRHLAEGAIAGLGAAEILRHHRERDSDEKSSRRSRVGKDLGAAALGAAGATAISRARSSRRSKSRRGSPSRSRSRSRDRERRKHRHRSRSRSKSRVRQLAGLGLAAAATAAAVGTRRRSDSASELPDDARDPAHRNKKIAQAGLAGAAVAGLVERARSKSRSGRGKSRSKSRIRQGLPVAAAGLGSAAIAGLYEKSQAGKKDKEARREARAERRKSSATASVPGLIEYGEQPVYSTGGVPDYYNRPASQAGYYHNQEGAVVPAAAAATGAAYGAERSRERRRSTSSDSDGGRRRRHRRHKSGSRSRSRTRDVAAAGLGAAGAAAALTSHEKRKQRKKEEKRERRRYEAEHGPGSYDERDRDQHPAQQQQPYSPMSPENLGDQGAGYPQQQEAYYPSTNSFPPPPVGGYAPSPGYDPAQYGQQPGQAGQQIHPDYGYPAQPNPYVPPGAQGAYSPQPANPYAPPGGNARRADENVSAEPFLNTAGVPVDEHRAVEEGLNTPLPRSPQDGRSQSRSASQPPSKSVQFNLGTPDSSSPSSPEHIRKRRQRKGNHDKNQYSDDYSSFSDNPSTSHHSAPSSNSRPHAHRQHRHHYEPPPSAPSNPNSSANTLVNSARSPSPTLSEATIDLPPRFDEKGRKIPEKGEDPLADKIENLFGGGGGIAKLMKGFLGGEDDPLGDGGKSRRRRGRD
ncbi:MAG: hypothetical protein LQ343_003722 [Gyalolechia ehrenbergii]|nr:MAG: hypothetical protein LQ343_003722 [Gyalolechia ehrenbergii]